MFIYASDMTSRKFVTRAILILFFIILAAKFYNVEHKIGQMKVQLSSLSGWSGRKLTELARLDQFTHVVPYKCLTMTEFHGGTLVVDIE